MAKKLSRNVERDKEVNDALTQEGWLVLRFWESDIQKKLDTCVKIVLDYASPRTHTNKASKKEK